MTCIKPSPPAFSDKESIKYVICELAKDRQLFWKEADFQFAFAWKLKELYNDAEIRLERTFKITDGKNEVINIDIWVRIDDTVFPIELKYKTKCLEVKNPVKTVKDNDGEEVTLKNQGAQDLSRYAFIKDIHRLETVLDSNKLKFGCGYAIFLTNDPTFWRERHKNYHKNGQVYPADYEFSLHKEITQGVHQWLNPRDWMKALGKINLRSSYGVSWEDYPRNSKYGKTLLRYLVIQVNQHNKTIK